MWMGREPCSRPAPSSPAHPPFHNCFARLRHLTRQPATESANLAGKALPSLHTRKARKNASAPSESSSGIEGKLCAGRKNLAANTPAHPAQPSQGFRALPMNCVPPTSARDPSSRRGQPRTCTGSATRTPNVHSCTWLWPQTKTTHLCRTRRDMRPRMPPSQKTIARRRARPKSQFL